MHPSNHEFFSRAGKSSLERFKILQDKEFILYNRPKVSARQELLKSLSESNLNFKSKHKFLGEDLEKLISSIKPYQQQKPQKPSPSAVFKGPDRSHFSVFNISEEGCRTFGAYDINYSLVHKHEAAYSIPKNKRPTKIEFVTERSIVIEPKTKKKKRKINGIPFDKQLERKPIFDGLRDFINKTRFSSVDFSEESTSKFVKTSSPDLRKYSPRAEIFNIPEFQPEYTPNKEKILPKLVKSIKFEKMPKREELFKNDDPSPETNYPVKYDLVEKKPKICDFTKELPREKDINCSLPSYMQISMSSEDVEKNKIIKKKYKITTSHVEQVHDNPSQAISLNDN
ncbi:unnamed protein product [Blepharisma stoltei]|uniref:Uncharacterized protein n=1 Tax=Blepharisma stoltei TaxID=1481888 RepID=A0AAU9IZX2_9CILI|nr:unnamed protein product [Blepharisma stoltei]